MIMALQQLLELSNNRKKIGISEERIRAILPVARQYVSFWREYPDLFVDFLQDGGDSSRKKQLEFYYYQRVFLRAAMRYKYVYMTFPRAYSKSFLSILVLMCRCVLYPGAKLFVTSGGKEQAATIVKEKVEEICKLVPAFKKEIDWGRGQTQISKDYCIYKFKSGSYFDIVAAKESSRGKRRHGGLVEECVGVDGTILNEVIIPTMNVSRRCMDGSVHPEESLNKSQIYVTTAGWKNTFPYEKLITLLVRMVVDPGQSIVMGGSWRIPVLVGLLDSDFLINLKRDPTFNEASFGREYESIWSGTVEDAFFNSEVFDRNRKIQKPEYEYSGRSSASSYYVVSVDVGRKGCDTVACILKVIPQPQGPSIKSLVNIVTMEDEHFENQAIMLKKLYYKYKAKRLVIDANGLGIGLIDYMIKVQEDDKTGEYYPPFGVYNDEENYYKKFRTDDTEDEAMYLIKANATINTEAHANLQTQLNAGKVKFLLDEREAMMKLMETKLGQGMTPQERSKYVIPFSLTSILKEELTNLREENEGVNIILKQVNRKIRKDKVSSLEYGLYYIKQEEDNRRKRKHFKVADLMFMN